MDRTLVSRLCENNTTPMYVLDEGVLIKRAGYLKKKLPGMMLCFAVKADPFIPQLLKDEADRFEICSPGEYYICEKLGLDREKFVISGVYKTPSFIEEVFLKDGGAPIFTVESLSQFELLKGLAVKHEKEIKLLIRLTSGNQFGMNKADIENILKEHCDNELLDFMGLQFYSGTQKASLKRLKRELGSIDEFLKKLYQETGFAASELEFGPGIPAVYFEGETFDEEGYLDELSSMLRSMDFSGTIALEVGRGLAASCGSFITRVVDMKTNKGQNYALVDGGIHQLTYFGQSMAMRQPFVDVITQKTDGEEEMWNICGSLCTVNDILVKQLPVKGLSIGDTLVFKNTGAYCMTEGISLFLSRDLPLVVIIGADGSIKCVRKPFETYVLNMVQI